MIKSTEIRIGNYIDCHGPIKVQMLDIVNINKGEPIHQEAYKPIELTEEWLLKLGFDKHKENGRYGYKYYIPINDYNYVVERDFNKHTSHFFGIEYTDCPDPKDDYIFHSFSFDLKYVHQLQNLYFALTAEELQTINQ